MGSRSATETLAQVFLILLQDRTITQAELARRVGVEPKAVKRCLADMQAAGMPLHKEEEHPHVYWSVPTGWVPGGATVSSQELLDMIRLLHRCPQTQSRDRVLERLLHRVGDRGSIAVAETLVVPALDKEQEEHLRVFEESVAEHAALAVRYFSASRGVIEDRVLSVQRIVYATPTKVVALCHKSRTLKWFRLDGVHRAAIDRSVPYEDESDDALDEFLSNSDFGFHAVGEKTRCVFFVRAPDHHWVRGQLGTNFDVTVSERGARFETLTSSLKQLASFVVSLGAAARAETPELADAVRTLALGALAAAEEGSSSQD